MKLIHPQAKAPTWADAHAMGCDLYCIGGLEGVSRDDWGPRELMRWAHMRDYGQIVISPGDRIVFRTGIAMAIPPGWGCLLWDRSGMGIKRGIHRLAGVIDENYRGEWFVSLVNLGEQAQVVAVGDRIVQGVFQRRVRADFPVVDALDDTGRGGLGSTGA